MAVTTKIRKAILEVNEKANTGELAYLLLTGRAENHIRDLVAFNFSKLYSNHKAVREEDRIDLRIYSPNSIMTNIEFKIGFAYTLIAENMRASLIRGVNNDIKKRPKGLINCVGVIHASTDTINNYKRYRYKNLHMSTNNTEYIWRIVRAKIRKLWPKQKKKYALIDCGVWDEIHVELLFVIMRNP